MRRVLFHGGIGIWTCWFLVEGGKPKNPTKTRDPTANSTHMWRRAGIEPRPHCWDAGSLTISQSLLPNWSWFTFDRRCLSCYLFSIRFCYLGNESIVLHSRHLSVLFSSGKGDSFGENFAIDPDRPVVNSNSSIRALTYCELRLITREDVLHILKQYPLFKENFIKDLEITYNLRGDDAEKVRHYTFFCLFLNCFAKVERLVL